MKILNIYFKNINSLEGESRIHFDKAPIVNGGVFAITGPNGSGKSSILDAITLGLYGETFRFDRPAEHVMTKSTAESFSEVEFSLGQDKYKVSWRVARADGNAAGELLAPEMKLVKLNAGEQVLEQSVQKVREKMLELTGMDFHKFSKSMVLAQGDFAAFLNALDSERMDILEKISGTDIYADYSQQAEEKKSQAQVSLQNLEMELAATPVMDELAVEASQHDLEDFKEQRLELATEQDEIEQKLNWVQQISSLEKQEQSLVKQQKQLAVDQEDKQNNIATIEAAQGVLAFEDDLSSLEAKEEQVQQDKKALESFQSEVEALNQQLKSSPFDENAVQDSGAATVAEQKENIAKLTVKLNDLQFSLPKEGEALQSLEQQKQQKIETLAQAEMWLITNEADKTLLDNFPDTAKLREAREQLTEASAKQTAAAKSSNNAKAALEGKTTLVSSTKAKINKLEAKLADNEEQVKTITEGNSFEELQELQLEQQQRSLDYLEMYDLAGVNAKLSKKGFFGQLLSFKKDEGELELEVQHDLLQLEIGKEKVLIETLELAVKNETLLVKMAADRKSLVEGRACPLCGSLKHPYVEHLPSVSNSSKVLKEQQKKIKSLSVDEASLAKQIVVAKKRADSSEQKEGKLKNVRSQWNALANRLNAFSLDLTIDNLALMKNLVKTEKKELSDIAKLLKQTSKLQASIIQQKEALVTHNSTLERSIKEQKILSEEWDTRPDDSDEHEQEHTQAVEQEKILTEQVEKQLDLLGEKLPKKAKEEVFFKGLNDRKQQYERQAQSLEPLAAEISKLDESIASSSKKITALNDSIQQYAAEVQQQEGAGLQLVVVEKQKLMADKESANAQQQVEMEGLKQALQDKIKSSPVQNIADLKEMLLVARSKTAVQQQQKVLNDKSASLNEQQQQLKDTLAAERTQAVTDESEYDLSGKLSAVKRKLDIAKQEVQTLQNKLDKQSGSQQKQQDLNVKIAEQKIELEAREAEVKSVSSGNNLDFKRKVQKELSDKLMSQSNQVLEKISGRYYVRTVESEHGLALEIEDTKQQNMRRLPKTLSGGESFIVSLALALGLAEMSNNGHALDSLFIDEGFGNLDSEALYSAMTALESLQTHGKVVGVISHVDGVKKRIKTQIEMSKKSNGLSALKAVS